MISLIDHPLLAARYFFPRRGDIDDAVVVTAADGTSKLACYRAAPFADPDAITVLHFHGNAEIVADYVPAVASVFNGMGVNAFFAEYRGYGMATGTPSLRAMLDDAEIAMRATGVPANRLVVFGRSLGSLFAVEVAANHPDVAGVVLESGIADPLEPNIVRVTPADLGTTEEALRSAVAERFDQREKLSRYRGPLLVLHTLRDMLIPVTHAQRLFMWGGAANVDKKLVLFVEGDHGTIYPVNRTQYDAELLAFFDRARDRRRSLLP